MLATMIFAVSANANRLPNPPPYPSHMLKRIHRQRDLTWHYQSLVGSQRTRYIYWAENHCGNKPCRFAILKKWHHRHFHWKHRWQHFRSSVGAMSPASAIRYVFGAYAGQALAVATCESGLRTTATNGQYYGLFQMGSSERATYAYSGYSTPYQQTIAAYRYFVASGRDWSPWSCKP